MSSSGRMFISAEDASLARMIDSAKERLVFVAPGLDRLTAAALVKAMHRNDISVTIIVDSDPEAYRLGYGDPAALKELHEGASEAQVPLRQQVGMRIGLLIADKEVAVWSPVARSVDAGGTGSLPNGILLTGHPTDRIERALGSDSSNVLPQNAEIGREALTPEELGKTIENLERSPPAPFDLTRRTRVFSSRFQFVEFEIRGAEWTERKIRLSNFLMNADLPESLQDIIDTKIRPFQAYSDIAFDVPMIVHGRPAFERNGDPMLYPHKQSDVMKVWGDIRDHYLRQLPGFGWLIRRDDITQFRAGVAAFENTLRAWVAAFREHVKTGEERLIGTIVDSIQARLERSKAKEKDSIDLRAEVRRGLEQMRVIDPNVRIVLKNVAWESTRDDEFLAALRKSLPSKDLEGWFEEYTAAREREDRG